MPLLYPVPKSTITYQTLTIPASSTGEPEGKESVFKHEPLLIHEDTNQPKILSSTWINSDASTKTTTVNRVLVDLYHRRPDPDSKRDEEMINKTSMVSLTSAKHWRSVETERMFTNRDSGSRNPPDYLTACGTDTMAVQNAQNKILSPLGLSVQHGTVPRGEMERLTGLNFTNGLHSTHIGKVDTDNSEREHSVRKVDVPLANDDHTDA
ncbi:hypothetical protein I302_106172 [Kwoniella bestiolae CBS 10118]|uniref:Uncharacterized protein n=1 Tax=Kwoniella bestiolae CBS 10118 TaxID=1296100 RepID=A0A1B9G389_9TREE|nr:hypothetical protein I302_05295 [Kwoniella bestiolae CBS 10118]OCF25475.1 hypothetical protein I302_05295 [Kwoniella bestiolae CBS 10118]